MFYNKLTDIRINTTFPFNERLTLFFGDNHEYKASDSLSLFSNLTDLLFMFVYKKADF